MNPKAAFTSQQKVELISSALEEKKAVDPIVIDVRGRTLVTDLLVIATGTSQPHMRALVDAVVKRLADNGIKNKRIEGSDAGGWVLLDYGDVVVHVLAPEQREYYKLESYWTGAEKGSPPPLSPEEV